MSYGFELYFKQVNSKEEAFEFALKVVNNVKKNATERIKNAKFYIPSHREMEENKLADEYWLYSTFTNSFTYWEEYNLLGMFSVRIPKETEEMFDTKFYFQNSTDQNYDYSQWGTKINYFNEVIDKVKKMSVEELFEGPIMKYWYHHEEDEEVWNELRESIEKDPEYYYQSSVYHIIFNELDLDTWMDDENESEKFIRFNLCAINGGDEYFKLRTILKVVKAECKEMDE